MENKTIIKVCAIILGIFIAFAIIEISIKAITQKVSDYSEIKQDDKKQEEIYNSDEAIEEREVREYVKNICLALEEKDYNYLWQKLDGVYRKYKFNDNIDDFKNYVETNVTLGEKYDVTYTNKTGKFYQVTVGITRENSYNSIYFTVNTKEKNSWEFMFDEYVELKEMSEASAYSDLNYEIIYYYNDSIVKTYVVKIKNMSEEDVKLEFMNTTLVDYAGNKIWGNKPETLELKAQESKNVEVYFNSDKISSSYLELEINKNGENKIYQINFSEYTA